MKFIFLLFSYFNAINSNGQKYVLLDKTMSIPPSYVSTVTIIDEYKNLFAIERIRLPAFLNMMQKLREMLTIKNQGGLFDFYLGNNIRFHVIKTTFKKNEERMDVVLTSNCITHDFSMHLCDARFSNSFNLFYMTAWLGYIKDNIK
jgi:hypothetical protein